MIWDAIWDKVWDIIWDVARYVYIHDTCVWLKMECTTRMGLERGKIMINHDHHGMW
jgi:hypothetical protein